MPETRYAKSGDVHVAYQVMGEGSDLLYVPGWISHLELEMENPLSRRFYESLARFTRLIRFDKRGTGMSDRSMDGASLEERVDDIRAVLEAVGAQRPSLLGFSEGGAMAAVFAARYPEQVDKLVLFGSHAGRVTGSEDFPCGYEAEPFLGWLRPIVETRWGEGHSLEKFAPTMWRHRKSLQAQAWMARFERMAATPGAALAHLMFNLSTDARSVLPSVAAPALVLHRAGDLVVPFCNGEHLAGTIPNARLVVLDGEDHEPYVGDMDRVVEEIERFLTGTVRHAPTRAASADMIMSAGLEVLTAAELRVAESVANGLSNPAIADALHVSRHTVQSHLKHIYAKLGIDSRVQLTRLILKDH